MKPDYGYHDAVGRPCEANGTLSRTTDHGPTCPECASREARRALDSGTAIFPPPADPDEVLEPDAQGFLTTAYERER